MAIQQDARLGSWRMRSGRCCSELFGRRAERRVITGMIEAAAGGDVGAFKALYERKYGKVKDVVEEKNEVVVTVEYE